MHEPEQDNEPRPFKIIDGRKWVLAEDEPWDESELWDEAEPELLGRIAPPPRELSLSVRLRLLFGSGSAPVFGLFFGTFGFIFALAALYLIGFEDSIPRRWVDAGTARIVRVEDLNFSMNDTPYMRYHFTITQPDGSETTAMVRQPENLYEPGDEIDVERSGSRYRIKGMGLFWGPWIFFGVGSLFGVIGLVIAGVSMSSGLKAIRLLRDGEAGTARFIDMQTGSVIVNGRPVMKLTFQHVVDGETHTVPIQSLETDPLIDGKNKIVFYDPVRPDSGVIFEALPKGITISEPDGRFRASLFRSLWPLLLSGIAVTEIVMIVYGIARAF